MNRMSGGNPAAAGVRYMREVTYAYQPTRVRPPELENNKASGAGEHKPRMRK